MIPKHASLDDFPRHLANVVNDLTTSVDHAVVAASVPCQHGVAAGSEARLCMIIDARTIPKNQTLETDICIIGAGAAGITLAHEFAGQAVRVSVLESGGLEYDAGRQDLSSGQNIGRPYFPLDVACMRYLGGTTNHWGGSCRPMQDIDFESRSWVPHSGWPFGKKELQPYYERARVVCKVPLDKGSTDPWLWRSPFPELPFDANRVRTQVGQVVPSAERRFGPNFRTELERAANVGLYLYANLTEFETNETASLVTEANVACLAGNRFKIKAQQFILAANGIENPRLLLLSNRRHPAGLGNQHDLVGRYFMEHPRLDSGILLPTNPRTSMGMYTVHRTRAGMVEGFLTLPEETIRREQILNVELDLNPVFDPAFSACVDSLDSEDVASLRTLLRAFRSRQAPDDFLRHLANVVSDLTTAVDHAVIAAPVPLPKAEVIGQVWLADPAERRAFLCELFGDTASAAYMEMFASVPLDHIQVTTRIEQAPNPESRVTLGPERDQLGLNRVRLSWQLTSLEKRTMIRALEILGAEAGRAEIGRVQINLAEGDTWPDTLRGKAHLMGTTRMNDDPRKGVVDRNCQVHGISNLFVAGSSVFPTVGVAPPTLTLVSLAIRLADHLKGRMN